MSHVFLQRAWDEAIDLTEMAKMVQDSLGCFGMHRVRWEESFLAHDKKSLFCHFSAPDAESVRIALRQLDTDMRIHWPGFVHNAPGRSESDIHCANVVVHRSFSQPVELEQLKDAEAGNIHCLENHRVQFMRTFFSADKRRMACLYQAPDAEAVRSAQQQAGMPLDSVWPVVRVTAESLA